MGRAFPQVRTSDLQEKERERLPRMFLRRDSLLLYVLTDGLRSYRAIGDEVRRRPHVRLRSGREADRWLAHVAKAAGGKRAC